MRNFSMAIFLIVVSVCNSQEDSLDTFSFTSFSSVQGVDQDINRVDFLDQKLDEIRNALAVIDSVPLDEESFSIKPCIVQNLNEGAVVGAFLNENSLPFFAQIPSMTLQSNPLPMYSSASSYSSVARTPESFQDESGLITEFNDLLPRVATVAACMNREPSCYLEEVPVLNGDMNFIRWDREFLTKTLEEMGITDDILWTLLFEFSLVKLPAVLNEEASIFQETLQPYLSSSQNIFNKNIPEVKEVLHEQKRLYVSRKPDRKDYVAEQKYRVDVQKWKEMRSKENERLKKWRKNNPSGKAPLRKREWFFEKTVWDE